ncbi:MAG: sulfite exporter TauE/SafE family protein [Blastocatellia bacterium]|nr:sulfite exporter TauE/SafE family protein [Blastocatellia bacterium]
MRLALLLVVAFVAGAMNSLAGGGTLLTFPALVLCGMDPIIANATSTVALWPGTLGAIVGYRGELRERSGLLVPLAVPSLVGGAAGALLLVFTPSSVFEGLVPFLILVATLLFAVHGPIRDRLFDDASIRSSRWWTVAICLQLVIAVYGGYFGAGIGVLMLALLGVLGLEDLNTMNGIKVVNGMLINLVAVVTFAISGIVDWPIALGMAAASAAGGWAGAGIARGIGQSRLRIAIIVTGGVVSLTLFYRLLR